MTRSKPPTITAAQSAQIAATMRALKATDRPSAPAEVTAAWDAVGAGMAQRMGIELAESDTRKGRLAAATAPVSTEAGSAWDNVVGEINATHGLKSPSI